MQTFTLLPERWWVVRVFGRNPLVRLSDRVGVLLVLLACAVSIIAAPVAGAVGTAVYDAHMPNRHRRGIRSPRRFSRTAP